MALAPAIPAQTRLREFTRARADLMRGAALTPKNMAAWYHLGLAHYFLGEFAESADAFRHSVETAPDNDERINSTNWLYAALRRAGRAADAARALEAIPPEMTNQAPHTRHYLNLIRFFQGKMSESGAPKAQEYFRRILKGRVWITWGFVGAETELLRKPK